MEIFADYLAQIRDPGHRKRVEEILAWIMEQHPRLQPHIKWNTPMFSDHGTYIIGLSVAKEHVSVAPEEKTMAVFADAIAKAGYSATKGLFRIRFDEPVDYGLLREIIEFNIRDKADCKTFWRK